VFPVRYGLHPGPAAIVNYRPILSSARLSVITNLQLSKENLKEKTKLFTGPRWMLTPGQTGRLTVCHKITLT
jgi:hypothetical protein